MIDEMQLGYCYRIRPGWYAFGMGFPGGAPFLEFFHFSTLSMEVDEETLGPGDVLWCVEAPQYDDDHDQDPDDDEEPDNTPNHEPWRPYVRTRLAGQVFLLVADWREALEEVELSE